MRIMLKVSLPVETTNLAMVQGTFQTTMKEILGELKPEAAYFTEEFGQRTAFIFLTLKEPAQIPQVAEPFFLAFNAKVELHPAMTAEDLAKAAPEIQKAAAKYAPKHTARAA